MHQIPDQIINHLFEKGLFRVSLSVGSKCDAKCPYCGNKHFEQTIASGKDLITATKWLINSFIEYADRFFVRLTGGEVGLVPDLQSYLKFVNDNDKVEYVQVFSKGDIFSNSTNNLLSKCHVSDHLIHDVHGERFVRYDKTVPPKDFAELMKLQEERRKCCKRYDCVMVTTKRVTPDMKKKLESCGIHFFRLMARLGIDKPLSIPTELQYRKCFFSKEFYVFDVSTKKFMHCCEEKRPELGREYKSPIDFFQDKMVSPYPQCRICTRALEIE